MAGELAATNVSRTYMLAASSITIFTFTLFFLYPRFVSGEANSLLFQATLVDMGVATFLWFTLWLVYLLFVIQFFPKVLTPMKSSNREERED